MSCCGGEREKAAKPAQKWDYINLSDFKSTSCITSTSYIFLWVLLAISVASYVVDVLVLIQMLRFNSWSSTSINSHNTIIPYNIARWIFLGCIIFSWVLLAWRWRNAVRAMQSRVVVKSYLDPLAVRIESIRLGTAQGRRRFFVFAKLSSHKKGLEYIALYCYFSFEAWLRILLAEGPRAVIQGLTIYSITKADFVEKTTATTKQLSDFQRFWVNVQASAQSSVFEAVVFCLMLWTTFLWALAFISLCIAALLYITVLWHQIPSVDGSLRNFCKRRADKSLEAIVAKKITKALKSEEDAMRKREMSKAKQSGQDIQDMKRQPTLPNLGDFESRPGSPMMPPLSRTATNTTMGRSLTNASNSTMSFDANAPLLGAPGPMGRAYSPSPLQNRPYSPAQSQGPGGMMARDFTRGPGNLDAQGRPFSPAPPMRSNTGNTFRTDSPGPYRPGPPGPPAPLAQIGAIGNAPPRPPPPGQFRPPIRQNTDMSVQSERRAYTPYTAPGSPERSASGPALDIDRRGSPALGARPDGRSVADTPLRTGSAMSGFQGHNRGMSATLNQGRASPALMPAGEPLTRTMSPGIMKTPHHGEDIELRNQIPRQQTPLSANTSLYTPYSPQAKTFDHTSSPSIDRRGTSGTPGTPGTPTQNFSNPLRRPPAQGLNNPQHVPSRLGTPGSAGLAPPAIGAQHDSIYDFYDRDSMRSNML